MPPRDACADAYLPLQTDCGLRDSTASGLVHAPAAARDVPTGSLGQQQWDDAATGQGRPPVPDTWASPLGGDTGLFRPSLDATLRAASGEDHLGAATALLTGPVLSVVLWVAAVRVVLTLL